MNNVPQEELAKILVSEIAQAHLVIRCVVRALVQQPSFDAYSFLQTLKQEEQQMTNDAQQAKDVIKTIISEVEGYN